MSEIFAARSAAQARPSTLYRVAPAALLFVLSVGVFGRGLFGSEALNYRDILHHYWPMHFIAALGRSHWSAWNPMHHAGLPLPAYVHQGVFYPPNLLFQFLEFPRAYCVHVLLHHFFAALGIYWLCLRLNFDRTASLGAAIAFSLTGFVVGLVYFGPFLSSAAYLPWVGVVLLGTAPLLARCIGLAAILCLQVLTGEPQLVISSLLFGFSLTLILPSRKREALALIGAIGLAALLGAIQLLPAWELFGQSTRSDTAGFASEWAFHPLRLLETALPYPFGGYLETPQFWAWFTNRGPATVPWALSVYLGSSTVALAVFGIGRRRTAALGIALFVLGVVIASGEHFPGLSVLHALPPFRFFRYPQKYFLLSAIGAVILAACGLEAMLEGRVSRARAGSVLAVSALTMTLASSISNHTPWALSAGRAVLDWARTAGDPAVPVLALRASILLGAPCAAAIAVLGLACGRGQGARSGLPAASWAYLAIAVVTVDLSLAAQRLVWFGPIELFRTVPAVVAQIKAALPFEPARFSRDDEPLDREAPHSRTVEQLQVRRAWELGTLKSNLGGVFGLEEASGRLPFSLRRYKDFLDALASSPAKRAALLNSCVILTSPSAAPPPDMRRVLTDVPLRLSLLVNTRCLPRLRSVQNVERVASPTEALERVADPAFDFQGSAAVEDEPSASYGPAQVEPVRWLLDGVVGKVHAGASGGFVVYSAVFYPGWRAQVDGADVPVRPVDGLLIGAKVPPGTHEISFHFHQTLLATGAWLSVLGLVVAAGGLVWAYRTAGRARRAHRRGKQTAVG